MNLNGKRGLILGILPLASYVGVMYISPTIDPLSLGLGIASLNGPTAFRAAAEYKSKKGK